MHKLSRAAVLAAAILASSAGCAGYGLQTDGNGHPTRKACDVLVAPPGLSYEVEGQTMIVAEVEATCDVTPQSHRILLSIELLDAAGHWSPILTAGATHTVCGRAPEPGNPTPCRTFIPCVDGTYRTVVTVTGVGPDGNAFLFSPPEERSSVIACPTWR